MAGWRAIRDRARGVVHDRFEFVAVYLSHAGGTPRSCRVRVHSRVSPLAMGASGDFDLGAGYTDVQPRLIFRPEDAITPRRNGTLVLGRAEVYRLGSPEGADTSGYTRCEATRLNEEEARAFTAALDASAEPWSEVLA